jgi:hypothetical protein
MRRIFWRSLSYNVAPMMYRISVQDPSHRCAMLRMTDYRPNGLTSGLPVRPNAAQIAGGSPAANDARFAA